MQPLIQPIIAPYKATNNTVITQFAKVGELLILTVFAFKIIDIFQPTVASKTPNNAVS
jgi:hypothetical protein